MTWSRIFLLWAVAVALGVLAGGFLGAFSSIVYQTSLPVGDVFAPLVLLSSLTTAAIGAWSGFISGLASVGAVALFDRHLRLPALRRNLIVGVAAGVGGSAALLLFYSGESNLESPWTFVALSAAIATTAFVAATVCGGRSMRVETASS